MIYKAFLKQEGEGCDYTIGCAKTVIDIEADNIDDAFLKLKDIILENYINDSRLELCELFEISNIIVCDLKKIYNE